MTYAACILWTVALAVWSAADDAEQIAAGERLNKALQWCVRAFGVTAFCVATGLWWMALPMGALFSMVFRFTLNRLRGLDWRYVAPSSWYDWQFIRLTLPGLCRVNDWIIDLDEDWMRHGAFLDKHKRSIHRAGLLAYIAEAVVIVGSVLIFA